MAITCARLSRERKPSDSSATGGKKCGPVVRQIPSLQRLYLALEQTRFGERLKPRFDVPDELGSVRVPAMILQPLVENAVKHGIARASGPVQVTVSARREGDELKLSVHDDATGLGKEACVSTGIGLTNVRARLTARHGSGAGLTAGRGPLGWASEIRIPLLYA